jgi:hypothetical protein
VDDAIDQMVRQWGIANPAEFYLGIAVCSGIPFLLMIFGAMLTQRTTYSDEVGWRFAGLAVASSYIATFGYALVGSFLPFFTPDGIPPILLSVMFVGNVLSLVGVITLFISIIADLRGFLRSPGKEDWALGRVIMWRMPLIVGLTLFSIIFVVMVALPLFM